MDDLDYYKGMGLLAQIAKLAAPWHGRTKGKQLPETPKTTCHALVLKVRRQYGNNHEVVTVQTTKKESIGKRP